MSLTKRWLEQMIEEVKQAQHNEHLNEETAVWKVAKANNVSYAELQYWVDKWNDESFG